MNQEKEDVKVGTNRTGVALARERAEQMVSGTLEFPPPEGDRGGMSVLRAEYVMDAEPVGTMPPPTSFKGLAQTAMKSIAGGQPTLFMDKLGERLGFERTGVRLYEALIAKHDCLGSFPGGPAMEELEEILEDEHAHFRLLLTAIESLSGDPTALTPSADLASIATTGVGAIVVDPRTTLLQCLEAIAIAELTDNVGWEVLVELAEIAGEHALLESFAQALAAERDHLEKVRMWIAAGQGRSTVTRNSRPAAIAMAAPPAARPPRRAAKRAVPVKKTKRAAVKKTKAARGSKRKTAKTRARARA